MCSFGDFAALSDVVDEATAMTLKTEVSDGIVAPGYDAKALEILKAKKSEPFCASFSPFLCTYICFCFSNFDSGDISICTCKRVLYEALSGCFFSKSFSFFQFSCSI